MNLSREGTAIAVVENMATGQWFFAPSCHNFGLGSSWYSVAQGSGSIGWPVDPTNPLVVERRKFSGNYGLRECQFEEMVKLRAIIPMRDYVEFVEKQWPKMRASQRFGQAFLTHFSAQFQEPWPELFYQEDEFLCRKLIRANLV